MKSNRKSITVIQKSFTRDSKTEILPLPSKIIMEIPKRVLLLCSARGDAAPDEDSDV